jgi:hypothetical protein
MARKRVVRATTAPRYMLKMYRLFGVQAPPEVVQAVVSGMNAERERGFGPYHQAWRAIQNEEWFAALPRGERGKVKAGLNYAIKALEKKLPDTAIYAHLVSVIGLSEDIATRLLDFVKGYRTPPAGA